ncbi:MAG: trypsin-like peptidase domain-containing protein [Candidatus Jorgensenbacteria bacterium]|nr:trypsin-like peptidase domain-containing protein [Candidatus Jorgensenbacteria bacterium]
MIKKEKSEIISTVKKVLPAVVSVMLSKHISELEKEISILRRSSHGRAGKLPFRIPPDKINAHGMVQVGGGSGFIVDASGIVLTNKHVVSEPNVEYSVIASDNETYPAEVLARDPIDDVAILKIKSSKKLPVVELCNSHELALGQTVLAFGNALGIFRNTVSRGIISGLSRSVSAQADIASPIQEMRGLIQTDAAINPGNSGGPLVDIFGRAIGINAAVVAAAENISFAIPIHAAWRDLEDIKQYGRIRRPLLGLRYITLDEDMKEKLGLPIGYGALVTHEHPFDTAVVPQSPAARAGIKERDIILTWNAEKITREKNIQDCLENCSVGDVIALTVLRGKKELSVKISLAERK